MPDVLQYQLTQYTRNMDSDEPIVLITTHIGWDEEDGQGVDGDLFIKELLALDQYCIENNKKRIQVWVNSPGGIVSDGMSIYSAILRTKTKCDTYCVGIAASIAGVIFQAGAKRVMQDNAYLMYHDPFGSDDKNGMEALTDSIITSICSRTGRSREDVEKILKKSTWMSATEALEEKFCDSIEDSSDFNKKRSAGPMDVKAYWKESNLILNKIFPKNKIDPMSAADYSKIANRLKLNPQCNDEAIIDEIQAIQDKKTAAEKKCEDLEKKMEDHKKEMEEKKKELADMKKEHDEMKKNYDEMKKKAEDEAEAKKKAEDDDKAEDAKKAKNYVDEMATKGAIPKDEDTLKLWYEQAKTLGLEKVKALLERQPLNKTAPKVDVPKSGNNIRKITSIEDAGRIKNVAASVAALAARADREALERKQS